MGNCRSPPHHGGLWGTIRRMRVDLLPQEMHDHHVCVSAEQLKDAQLHPDRHRDLVVRVSGLSARFVALTREVQDEIITRTLVQT